MQIWICMCAKCVLSQCKESIFADPWNFPCRAPRALYRSLVTTAVDSLSPTVDTVNASDVRWWLDSGKAFQVDTAENWDNIQKRLWGNCWELGQERVCFVWKALVRKRNLKQSDINISSVLLRGGVLWSWLWVTGVKFVRVPLPPFLWEHMCAQLPRYRLFHSVR
jgi:hypothetical protein